MRTTFTLDEEFARSDRKAYQERPERSDSFWSEAEAWGEQSWAACARRSATLSAAETDISDPT
ncbi:MAG: hypothetical protein ACYDEP_09240 [Acidimicrobiales bacterium]